MKQSPTLSNTYPHYTSNAHFCSFIEFMKPLIDENMRAILELMGRMSEIGLYPGIEPLLLDGVNTCKKRLKTTCYRRLGGIASLGVEILNHFTGIIPTLSQPSALHLSTICTASLNNLHCISQPSASPAQLFQMSDTADASVNTRYLNL